MENFRRRSVRVLKLHRGFILTKKGDINPHKNLETPPGPLGGVFRFFKVFFENFKICPRLLRGWGRCLKVTLQTRDWSELSASTSLMSYGDGRQT